MIFILFICAGPLLAFIRPMREARDDGAHLRCAGHLDGEQFEDRWLSKHGHWVTRSARVPDSPRPTDLFSVVAGVDAMRAVPIQLKDFIPLLMRRSCRSCRSHPPAGLVRGVAGGGQAHAHVA
jgi:hypothetical protein